MTEAKLSRTLKKEAELAAFALNPVPCGNAKCSGFLSPIQAHGKGTYCSRSCSHSAVVRLKPESKEKMRATFAAKPRKKKHCRVCQIEYQPIRQEHCCSDACRHHARLIGAKKSVETRARCGTFSGWHNRRGEPSYPEKYFMSVFENEGISGWTREKKVGRWFIDFAFEKLMLAVEIDGKQHEAPDRKVSDTEKDAFLNSHGWQVVRIPWTNPRTQDGKNKLYPHVKMLLELLH
jgi:very-short-patch-repair endonuclease